MAAVTYAARHGLPVAVLSTGHGASLAADGAVLITTRRMQGVRIDPFAATARIEAGVLWSRVVHEAAPFGLAPLSGSAPEIGAIGYTLGGGLGLLGRAFGYSADHVRSIDLVTANGTLRTATAQQYADLFWALRGGKGNFGVVTSMEIGLFRVSRLFGGGLYLPGSSARSALHAYRRWVREMRHLSGALGREPDVPNAVAGRDAAFQLYLAGVPGGDMPVELVAQEILDRMLPWTAGAASLNFMGTADTTTERVRAAFSPAGFRRLVAVKRNNDPDNIFRFNHNIPTVLPAD